jgi:low affinity Fe/Cu permease
MTQSSTGPGNCPSLFTRFSRWTAHTTGRPCTFVTAVALIIVWGLTGPLFNFSDTWQLVINTGTTIITFLMVFLIQATQNRDSQALHVKLDELIRAVHGARNSFLNLDDMSDEELEKLHEHFVRIAAKTKRPLVKDTPNPARNGVAVGK